MIVHKMDMDICYSWRKYQAEYVMTCDALLVAGLPEGNDIFFQVLKFHDDPPQDKHYMVDVLNCQTGEIDYEIAVPGWACVYLVDNNGEGQS